MSIRATETNLQFVDIFGAVAVFLVPDDCTLFKYDLFLRLKWVLILS